MSLLGGADIYLMLHLLECKDTKTLMKYINLGANAMCTTSHTTSHTIKDKLIKET